MSRRHRSQESKDRQLERIIEAAIDLYDSGDHHLTMRTLASKLGLSSVSSLYTYVRSKEELWRMICAHDFREFEKGMVEIAHRHEGDYRSLVSKLGGFFIDYSLEDINRFRRMFLTPPADVSAEMSPTPQAGSSLSLLIETVEKAMLQNSLQGDPVIIGHFLWAVVVGTSVLLFPHKLGTRGTFIDSDELAKGLKEFALAQADRVFDI